MLTLYLTIMVISIGVMSSSDTLLCTVGLSGATEFSSPGSALHVHLRRFASVYPMPTGLTGAGSSVKPVQLSLHLWIFTMLWRLDGGLNMRLDSGLDMASRR